MRINEPIAAISTPYGRGGIAVIRMCGEGVFAIADRLFSPAGKTPLSSLEGGHTAYGEILSNGVPIDDGIATVFRAPHSYTGEDTVEISCHGGIALTASVLQAALRAGCRAAMAGEFTKRAFLNGKLSLSQAEAVIGLIDAASEEQIRLSSAMRRGVLYQRIDVLADRLTDLIASVYAYMDYPDEDLTDYSAEELLQTCQSLHSEVASLTATYRTGRAVCEGIRTVIVGKPNTGKSSLLNRILGRERAIVTPIAGTTRDTVEETVSFGGVTLRLIDTAGLRDTDNEVERIGVTKTRETLAEAELVLAVFDGSSPLDEEDRAVCETLSTLKNCEVLFLFNKSDLPISSDIQQSFPQAIRLSAQTGEGLDRLAEAMAALYQTNRIDYDTTPILASARQFAAAEAATAALADACRALSQGFTQDIAGMDLEIALAKLRELDGKGATEEVTDRIFSRFCVGK